MMAQQLNLDAIANNLSNADVAGFKAVLPSFTALGAPGESGLGTASLGEHAVFTQGRLSVAPGAFDLAIEGDGFFRLVDSRGRVAFTRNGEFSRAADGTVCNAAGYRLDGVRIPSAALGVNVSENGVVSVVVGHGRRVAGRIVLAQFAAPERLRDMGGTIFEATAASGAPQPLAPGDAGPRVRFGMLEQSNVSIIEAMMAMLAAQRAYEADAKGVQAADEMLRVANNLQRG